MRSRGVVLVVIALCLLVGPLIFLGWLRLREDRLDPLEPVPTPVLVTVEQTSVDDQQPVLLSLEWRLPDPVAAPGWSGTVTALQVGRGDELHTGDVVVQVDGIDRIAAATERPFWRPLQAGDRGDDVAELQKLLGTLGLHPGQANGSYGTSTAEAVRALSSRLGLSPVAKVFDPSWIVWLPQEPFDVASIEAAIGWPAPSSGSALLNAPAMISSLEIQAPDGAPLELSGRWEVDVANLSFTVIDEQFTVDDQRSLAAEVSSASTELPAIARLRDPVRVVRLPATAVALGPSGDTCVWVVGTTEYDPVVVHVSGGRAGTTDVTGKLVPGSSILANPGEVLDDSVCP